MSQTDTSGSQTTPRSLLSGIFGPRFLDDPEALAGIASSLGMGSGASGGSSAASAPSAAPAAPGAAPGAAPAPIGGVVPQDFQAYRIDPVNQAKIPTNANFNGPLDGSIPPLIARPDAAADVAPSPAPVPSPAGVTQSAAAPAPPASGMPQPAAPTPFPDFKTWISDPANAAKAAIPLAPKQYTGRGFVGMSLATLGDSLGAALTGNRPTVGPGWLSQVQAGREYERNLPVLTNQAQTAAYERAQEEAGRSASIGSTEAQTAHTIAETNALLGGGPFYEQAGKVRQDIQQLWQSGNLAPADFEKAAALKLQGVAPNVQRLIPPDFLQQVKALPQQPPAFKVEGGAVQPITWQGKQYGVTPEEGEPTEITQARSRALASQEAGEFSKAAPEIVAQIGPYPTNGTKEEQAAWGKKAEQIKINESASPKLIVQNAANGPLGTTQPPSGVTGEAALANADPSVAATVRMIGDGKTDFSTFTSRMPASAKVNLAAWVHAYNPDFDQNTFSVRKGVETGFTSGNYSQQLNAISTARNHMQTFRDMADALDNGNVKVFNSIGNSWAEQTGNPAPTNFQLAKDAFQGEVGKAFAGVGVTEGDRKQVDAAISAANSPAALRQAADTADKLLEGKQKSLKDTFNQGMAGKPNFGNQNGPTTTAEPTATGANGHKIAFRNGKWVDASTNQPVQ